MNCLDLDYQKVTPAMLEKAMVHFGWSKIKTFPNKKTVWASQSGSAKQWVPLDDGFDDYYDCVVDTVQSISRNSKVDSSDINLYLKQFFYNKDLVQLRIEADDIHNGSISLNDGVDLFGAFKQIIAGAVKEVSGAVKDVKDAFFSGCELGQTTIGSYVVNAYLPVLEETRLEAPGQQSLNAIEPMAIGRKINQTLINRLTILQEVMTGYSDENSIDVVRKLLEIGYTKKECEAIGVLFGKNGHHNWEVKVLWSHLQTIPAEQRSLVRFDKTASSNAREIANKFKRMDYRDHITLTGRVASLDRDYVYDIGKIILKSEVDDVEVSIKVVLDNTQYRQATHAHNTKTHIEITGDLIIVKSGKSKNYVMNHVESMRETQLKLDLGHSDNELDANL